MVHDDAADRRANAFVMDAKIHEYCERIRDAGIELHLTAWAQPYTEYLTRACDELVKLVGDYGACSVCWDAEEPWTQAIGGLEPAKAAEIINLYGAREGVTCIGYASHEVDPLVARAAYVAPQAYVTKAEGGLAYDDPNSTNDIPGVLGRWRKRAPGVELVPALAAWGQVRGGIVQAWRAAGKPKRVLLWSMRHIANRPTEVQRLVDAMSREAA